MSHNPEKIHKHKPLYIETLYFICTRILIPPPLIILLQVMVLTSKLQDKEGTVVILEEHILQLKREHETQMADFMQDKNEEEEVR